MIYQGKARYPVVEVVLHCAAINTGQFNDMTGEEVKAEIDKWHRKRGFKGFGYHGLFMPDGTFVQGRPFTQIGAHVMERNRGTLGFLMIESKKIDRMGRFLEFFTLAQRKAVMDKIKSIDGIRWVTGHNDYANKLCPGFKVEDKDWL